MSEAHKIDLRYVAKVEKQLDEAVKGLKELAGDADSYRGWPEQKIARTTLDRIKQMGQTGADDE